MKIRPLSVVLFFSLTCQPVVPTRAGEKGPFPDSASAALSAWMGDPEWSLSTFGAFAAAPASLCDATGDNASAGGLEYRIGRQVGFPVKKERPFRGGESPTDDPPARSGVTFSF